jgi:hypothetical protein
VIAADPAASPGTRPLASSVIEYSASTKRETYPTRARRPRPALKTSLVSLSPLTARSRSAPTPRDSPSGWFCGSVNLRKWTAPDPSSGC